MILFNDSLALEKSRSITGLAAGRVHTENGDGHSASHSYDLLRFFISAMMPAMIAPRPDRNHGESGARP